MSLITINHGVGAAELRAIRQLLTELKEIIMTTAAEFTAAFERVDTATTAIAIMIRDLVAAQQSGNMSADEEDAAQARLLKAADALEAMAATPANPVPVPVP